MYNVDFLSAMFLHTYVLLWVESIWKKPIHFSVFKYSLKDSVESIFHTRFEAIWSIIMISIQWYLDSFIIYHFLTILSFPIINHEVTLLFLLIQVGNIFIMHHKILILHISVWTLININITVYYIYNLYCLIIIMCSIIINTHILNFSQYPSNKYLSSDTSCGASIPT